MHDTIRPMSMLFVLAVDLQNPLTWALVIGWIPTVVLHEFAHGLVAYLGGDYTIRERGGLSLNPIQYIDPIFSIALPVLFLLMGGIPLPGGVTYIRRDLIKSNVWNSLVSTAGPLMNLLLFLLLSLPFHPALKWIDTTLPTDQYKPWQVFLAALAFLQMIAVVINLLPIPPLDGFQIISPWLDPKLREKLTTPPVSSVTMVVLFALVWGSPRLLLAAFQATMWVLTTLGFDENAQLMMVRAYRLALVGSAD